MAANPDKYLPRPQTPQDFSWLFGGQQSPTFTGPVAGPRAALPGLTGALPTKAPATAPAPPPPAKKAGGERAQTGSKPTAKPAPVSKTSGPAPASGGGAPGAALGPVTTPSGGIADPETIKRTYPQFAWAIDHPEIGKVLIEGIEKGWDGTRLMAAIQGTQYWKKTLPAQRAYEEKMQTDPAAIQQQLRQQTASLSDMARGLGIGLSDGAIGEIARQSIMLDWNENEIKNEIGRLAFYQQGQKATDYVGLIGNSVSKLAERSGKFMVPITEETKFNWAKKVAMGENKIEDFDVILREQAKARFSYDESMVQRIAEGYDPSDLLAPQRAQMAKLLEVGDEQIDLTNPRWAKVLEFDDGNGKRRVASIAEAAKAVRADPAWRKTTNGQQAGATMVQNLSKMFRGA